MKSSNEFDNTKHQDEKNFIGLPNRRDFEGQTYKNYELFMIIFSKLSKALTYIDRSDTGKIIEFIA